MNQLAQLLSIIGRLPDDPCTILTQEPAGGPMSVQWTTVARAPHAAEAHSGKRNVFYGVQPLLVSSGRGKGGDIVGVCTLYADIDRLSEKKAGGATPDQAMSIIGHLSNTLGVEPSAIVNSGGGWHPYWPIEELDPFTGADALMWWREQVIAAMTTEGCKLDTGVYDLARILRVCGPPNMKPEYGPQGASTSLVVTGAGSRISNDDLLAAIRAHPTEGRSRAARPLGAGGFSERGDNGDDRVFTPEQFQAYLQEKPGRVRIASGTPHGAGFNAALNQACFDIAAGVPEILTEEQAWDLAYGIVEAQFPGGPDANDIATIRSGFAQARWTARKPTEDEQSNPFSLHADHRAIKAKQGGIPVVGHSHEEPEAKFEPTRYSVGSKAEAVVEGLAEDNPFATGPARNLVSKPAVVEVEPLPAGTRRLSVVSADRIVRVAPEWLWEYQGESWIPLSELTLLSGREGVGKSTWTARLVAQVTNGKMHGEHLGKPKGVVICATEDTWDATIANRLLAAGADLSKVYRVDAQEGATTAGLVLPTDVPELTRVVTRLDVAMIVLDPLLGTIAGKLDTHKDSDVRQALEPISRLAHDTRCSILGLVHQNKGQGDLLTKLMGSVAFSAVARSVLVCMRDDKAGEVEDVVQGAPASASFLMGQAKNNLGKTVETTIRYEIESVGPEVLGRDPYNGKAIRSSKIRLVDYADSSSIRDSAAAQEDGRRAKGGNQVDQCAQWLRVRMCSGEPEESSLVKAEADDRGYSLASIKKACTQVGMRIVRPDKARHNHTLWQLPLPDSVRRDALEKFRQDSDLENGHAE